MERLLAAMLVSDPQVVVSSAGTYAMVGWPMDGPMAQLVAELGVDPGGFAARRLTPELVREADLVLTATREHRAAVVRQHPAAVRYTFTLKEFVRLVQAALAGSSGSLPGQGGSLHERLAALVSAAVAQRGVQVVSAAEDDVVDPYNLPDAAYQGSFLDIKTALEQLHGLLEATA